MGTQLLHPTLAKAALPLNAHVAKGITVSTRVRELLILRIAWLQRSEYEYVQHIRQGKLAGLTEEEIERVQQGPDASGWDPLDADLLRAVDELHHVACIQGATWTRLADAFRPQAAHGPDLYRRVLWCRVHVLQHLRGAARSGADAARSGDPGAHARAIARRSAQRRSTLREANWPAAAAGRDGIRSAGRSAVSR